MMISAQMRTRQRVVAVRHCVIVTFNPAFICAECQRYLICQVESPTVVGKFAAFYVKFYIPFLKDACAY